MKMGVRKPSLKKSLKARTTGKLKRKLKKSVNPLYGKKGMGMINNPKKALYNKVYNKTTVSAAKVAGVNTKSSSANKQKTNTKNQSSNSGFYSLIGLSFIASIVFFIFGKVVIGLLLFSLTFFIVYLSKKK